MAVVLAGLLMANFARAAEVKLADKAWIQSRGKAKRRGSWGIQPEDTPAMQAFLPEEGKRPGRRLSSARGAGMAGWRRTRRVLWASGWRRMA